MTETRGNDPVRDILCMSGLHVSVILFSLNGQADKEFAMGVGDCMLLRMNLA